MEEITLENVCEAIQEYLDPNLNEDLLSADAIKDIRITGREVEVDIELGFPCGLYREWLEKELSGQISERLSELDSIQIHLSTSIASASEGLSAPAVKGVKNIIAIGSARGGTGKTTLALNFALALAREGARVGLVEGDSRCPTALYMLGEELAQVKKMGSMQMPIISHGVNVSSLCHLDPGELSPHARAPQLANGIRKLLDTTLWGELDYLLLDLPSSEELFYAVNRVVPLAGLVMIAMPHRLSQIHTRSSLDVYKKSSVPVLGVVENMSLYLCPHCGRVDPVWGDGGIKALADEYKIPLLGSVPLMRAIRQSGDEGDPTAILDDHEKISHAFHEIVRKFTARLSRLGAVGRPG